MLEGMRQRSEQRSRGRTGSPDVRLGADLDSSISHVNSSKLGHGGDRSALFSREYVEGDVADW